MYRISAVLHQYIRMTLVCKIRAKNGGIFQSHLDSSSKHIVLGSIRGFDSRLPIEVKFY
jgi:hypothetical protein